MTPEQLKASILQMAIQGKLVEQRPEEGSTEEYLSKVTKELKNTRRVVEDEEKYIDIPSTWSWACLSDVTTDEYINDGNWILSKDMVVEGDVKLIQLGSIGDNIYKNKGFKYLTQEHFRELNGRQIYPGYLLVNRLIGDKMLSCILPELDGILMTAVDVCWIAPHENCYDIKFIMYALSSSLFQEKVKELGRGTTRFRISKLNLMNIAFPLPPLEEQHRIVAKIEELLPFVDRYAASYEKLEQFNAKFPEDMKKSILQYAIQGKLVEQRPEEGTSEELYQQIQQEKQKIEKKSKKSVTTDAFLDDEILFDIPETWKWVHLKDIMSVYGGKRIPAGKKLTKENTGHIYIRVSDMKDGSVMDTDIHYVPEDIYPIIKNYTISKDDVYITVAGTIGRVGIIPEKFDNANLTENADKLIIYSLNKEYVMYLMSSPIIQRQIIEATTKVGQPKLAIKRIEDMAIPLPPLKEQERIVAKIKELMPYCDWLVK